MCVSVCEGEVGSACQIAYNREKISGVESASKDRSQTKIGPDQEFSS